jgi:hypothetical protein
MVHPQKPGERGVQFNMARLHYDVQGIVDNFDVINGTLLLEIGTLMWGVSAPVMSALWRR